MKHLRLRRSVTRLQNEGYDIIERLDENRDAVNVALKKLDRLENEIQGLRPITMTLAQLEHTLGYSVIIV